MTNTNSDNLIRRAKEYAEFYEATKNFNALGFFNDLIGYLEVDHKAQHAAECRDKAIEAVIKKLKASPYHKYGQEDYTRFVDEIVPDIEEAITKALTPEKNDG